MLAGYTGAFPDPAVKAKGGSLYSGKQLFSLFLPKDFNYVITSKWSKGTKGPVKDVVIKNGQLVSGVIDKASIGAEEPDSVLHRITKDYGYEEAKNFLNSILIMLKQFKIGRDTSELQSRRDLVCRLLLEKKKKKKKVINKSK